MSKVYEEKVQKARMLVEGMKNNYEQVKGLGITQEQIDLLAKYADEASVYNKEVEQLREQVSAKVACANRKMDEIRDLVMNAKGLIKRRYDNTEWIRFGIADKR